MQNHSCLKASVRGELAPFHQGVPYFCQELNLTRRRRLARRILLLLAPKLVHGLDRHEQDEGHDNEAMTLLIKSPILTVGAPAWRAAASES